MKQNKIRIKVIATALSAITVLSVGTMATTTAFAAKKNLSAGTHITNENMVKLDRDLVHAKNITSATLLKILDAATKHGKYFAPALGGLLDAFIEKADERTEKKVNEISEKVDKIFNKIEESESSIKAEITNDLGIQSFYNTFVKFKSKTSTMNKKIREIYDSKLSNADKLAKIGSLTGNFSEWDVKFENVWDELNNMCKKPSMTKNGNVFDLAYDHYKNNAMFSGEALDKAKPICEYIMKGYSAGCATLIESLSAQLYYNNLTSETKAKINSDYSNHICKDADDIKKMIDNISKHLLPYEDGKKEILAFKDGYGNIHPPKYDELYKGQYFLSIDGGSLYLYPIYGSAYPPEAIHGMFDRVYQKSRSIFVNKGHDDIELKDALKVRNHDDERYANGSYDIDMGERAAKNFNFALNKNPLNGDKIRAIASYAKDKGITVRKLLENNGFDVSKLPKNTNLVTEKAWDDSTSLASFLVMYNYQKAYYKGINIDQKGAGETTVQLLDCGKNIWNNSEWNRMLGGNACSFAAKK